MKVKETKITTEDIKKASEILSKVLKEDREKKINKEMKWIPTTERLPKKDGTYLVTTKSGMLGFFEYIPTHRYAFTYERLCTENFENGYVEAWMPLPEPYKNENNR